MKKKREPAKCSDIRVAGPSHSTKTCCQEQQITVRQTSEATTVTKTQVTERASFDVLFILNFVRTWFGYNQQGADEDAPETRPYLRIPESLTILFRQFRI